MTPITWMRKPGSVLLGQGTHMWLEMEKIQYMNPESQNLTADVGKSPLDPVCQFFPRLFHILDFYLDQI